MDAVDLEPRGGACVIDLPTDRNTHWFLIEAE